MTSRINNPEYLKLNLPLNNNTDDVSGNGNNGTPTSLTYSTNQFGKGCGDFSTATSRIDIGTILNGLTEFTISAWVKVDAGFSDSDRIFNSRQSGDTYFDIRCRATNQFNVNIVNNGSTQASLSGGDMVTNKESFVCVIIKKNDFKLYVDGELVDSDTNGNIPTSYSAQIFGYNVYDSSNDFNGNMHSIKIHNISLTGDEILELYHQSVPMQTVLKQPKNTLPDITDSSLIGAWLNTETRGTAKDYSNEGNDGTNHGVILGDGGEFNGSSGYIEIGNIDDFLLSNSFTIVLSVKYFGGQSDNVDIIGKHNSGKGYVLEFGVSDGLKAVIGTIDSWKSVTGQKFNVNEYYRAVMVYNDNTSYLTLYMDGVNQGSTYAPNREDNLLNKLWIGGSDNYGQYFKGNIKNVEFYNESKDQSWVTADFQKSVPDSSLVLYIQDDKDLSRFNTSLTLSNAIIGKGIEFDNGGIAWSSIIFTSYEYWYKTSGQWKHYLNDGTNTYIDGALTGSMPVEISATGFSSVTGEMKNIKLFNEIKTSDYALEEYKKTRKFY